MTVKHAKLEKTVAPDELPAMLRELADYIERNAVSHAEGQDDSQPSGMGVFDAAACLHDFRRIRLTARRRNDDVFVELGIESTSDACPDGLGFAEHEQIPVVVEFYDDVGEFEPKIKYKKLKKRMKYTFKSVLDSLAAGEFPAAQVVSSFLSDSHLMVTYPGYGESFYDAYMLAHNAFEAAWNAKDLTGMQHAAHRLDVVRKACHDKYK